MLYGVLQRALVAGKVEGLMQLCHLTYFAPETIRCNCFGDWLCRGVGMAGALCLLVLCALLLAGGRTRRFSLVRCRGVLRR